MTPRRKKTHGGRRPGSGQPIKSPTGEARTRQIPVKVSPAEIAALREDAEDAGQTLADYVRGELGLSNVSEQITPKETE